jgi:hypothetical protein
VATRIVNVESQAFDTWSGWNPERIARFVASKSGLEISAPEVPGQETFAPDVPAQETSAPEIPGPAPAQAREALWAYGVLESPALVRGGARAHVVLTLGLDDTLAAPQQGNLEWDLAVGPAGGRAAEQLARRQVALVAGEPRVLDTLVAVPAGYERARLVAVVRMLGPGGRPTVVRRLTDSSLAVTADLPGTEVS